MFISIITYFSVHSVANRILLETLGNTGLNIAIETAEKLDSNQLRNAIENGDFDENQQMEIGSYLRDTMTLVDAEYIYIMSENTTGDFYYLIEGSDYDDPEGTSFGETEENHYEGFESAMNGTPLIED